MEASDPATRYSFAACVRELEEAEGSNHENQTVLEACGAFCDEVSRDGASQGFSIENPDSRTDKDEGNEKGDALEP